MTAEVGQVFGRLTVKELGKYPASGRPGALVECRGSEDHPHEVVEKWVVLFPLVKGTVLSCGCLQRELASGSRSDSPSAQRMRDWRERRQSPDYQPKVHWRADEGGRECAYEGAGSCGHQYKAWSEFGPGSGPREHETRCKPCMVVRATDYLSREPEDVRQRRNARQAAYQKTPAGKEVGRRARLAYRYGISSEQYSRMLEEQEGLCYFCGFRETVTHHATGKVMLLAVEHSHACDKGHDPKRGCPSCVRGLACYNCNIFIERAERSPLLRPRVADLLARRPLLATMTESRQ